MKRQTCFDATAVFSLISTILLFGAMFLAWAAPSRAEEPGVVRLSYVKGSVTVKQQDASIVDHSVANMPVFTGSTITSGTDGEAEIEFADGSVARLTPNSSLLLSHLQPLGGSGHSDLVLASGLAYFELNVGQGQRFTVRVGPAVLRPMENSIFRASLDKTPEAAVFAGSLHVDAVEGGSDFNEEIIARQTARFDARDPASSVIADEVTPDTWDQWNTDRDEAIAQEAQRQTAVRDSSQAPNDPGWNDLDANGNWYPVQGYGDVWTPSDVDAGWDPFGDGYWANFQGYGATWISAYPWGWLPYHCGAWNYFPFGWGWVPGGCGAGWSPLVTVWNTPPNYRLPAWPKGGFIVPSQHRTPAGIGLVPVNRAGGAGKGVHGGPGSTGATGFINRGMRPAPDHEQSIQFNGNTIRPIAAVPPPALPSVNESAGKGAAHVGVPVGRGSLQPGPAPAGDHLLVGPARGLTPGNAPTRSRPTYAPSAPARTTPATPARSAPPAPAPHAATPPASGRPH